MEQRFDRCVDLNIWKKHTARAADSPRPNFSRKEEKMMNKKTIILLCVCAAAVIVLLAFLLGRKPAAPAQNTPSPSATQSSTDTESPAASASAEAAAQPRALSDDELKRFADQLNAADNYGFLLSEYSDVRDADLTQIFYSGAGIAPAADAQAILDARRAALGDAAPDTAGLVLKTSQIDEFLKSKTGYTLKEMHSKLDWDYDPGNDAYLRFYGDTNQIHVLSASGKALGGDRYKITCTYDGPFYIPDVGLVSGCITTFSCKDGKITFLSNTFVQ
jgi:hypothetical protein